MRRDKLTPRIKASLLVALGAVVSPTESTETTTPQTEAAVVFQAFAERGTDGKVQLINGVKAERKDWPTILNARLSAKDEDPPATCTGVLVGPGVFLTAAHCFDSGPGKPVRSDISFEVGGQKLPVSCVISEEYSKAIKDEVWDFVRPRVSQDYALCSFKVPNVLPEVLSGLLYENIDSSDALVPGISILMTGFGCSKAAILVKPKGDLKLDGLLRIGDATIHSGRSDGNGLLNQFASIRSPLNSAPALCAGDSGGPLFSGATTTNQTQPRKVRAVNSSIQIVSTENSEQIAISRVTPLATDSFRKFVNTWLTTHKQNVICGLNSKPGFLPCRN